MSEAASSHRDTRDTYSNPSGIFCLLLRRSSRKLQKHKFVLCAGPCAAVFYTVGWWNQTQPLEMTLVKGRNTLNFTRSTERTITFKSFVSHSKRLDVPLPFPPYTPTPAPPPSAYRQVPPATTCEKQGIAAVPVGECPQACAALGLNFAGSKSMETDMPGCLAIVTGHYEGDCMYNTNASAHCVDPPCYDRQAGCLTPGDPKGCEVAGICLPW